MTRRTKHEILESYYCQSRAYTPEEEADFNFLALTDFEIFFKHVIGHQIGEYHKKLFKLLKSPRVCIMSPRGHAKTEICSVCYTIWKALSNPGYEIVIVSGAENQSRRILRRVKDYITDNEFLQWLKPKHNEYYWSKSEMEMSNRTRITSQPFTDTIKGNRIDLCVCDDLLKREVANQQAAIEKFFEIISPACDKPNSQLIVVGTPQSESDLLHILSEPERHYTFERFQCCTGVVSGKLQPPALFPERFTMQKLQEIYYELGVTAFRQEMMCVPIQSGELIFDYENLIKPCTDNTLKELEFGVPANEYWLGIDVALSKERYADWTAFVIVEKRPGDTKLRCVRVETPTKGTYTSDLIDRVKELHRKFKFKRILIENKGNSMTMVEFLQRDQETMGMTEDFPTTHTEKERILLKVQKMMQNGQLDIYRSEKLIGEMQEIGLKHIWRSGRATEKLESLTGHDDTVIAFALAVEAATSNVGQVAMMWA